VTETEPLSTTVRRRRIEMGMTQREFAAALGVKLRTVQSWEADESSPWSRKPAVPVLRLLATLKPKRGERPVDRRRSTMPEI
jgi:DNA-binding transcriptional regulator YiaG